MLMQAQVTGRAKLQCRLTMPQQVWSAHSLKAQNSCSQCNTAIPTACAHVT